VAPLDAFQLKVTVVLACTGPGLVVVPGLVPVGVGGIAAGVWNACERSIETVIQQMMCKGDVFIYLTPVCRRSLLFLVDAM